MSKERFYRDVRRAWLEANSTRNVRTLDLISGTDPLKGAVLDLALWASPKVVARFQLEDFAGLDPSRRDPLGSAVSRFRDAAKGARDDGPLTGSTARDVWTSFEPLARNVQGLILEEWRGAVDELITGVETWSRKNGWLTARKPETLEDLFLGSYKSTLLHIAVDLKHLVLRPVSRFGVGATGLADLLILPAFEEVKLSRARGVWKALLPDDGERPRFQEAVWDEARFNEACRWLVLHE